MGELDFRKKRKKTNKQAGKVTKNKRESSLHFKGENAKVKGKRSKLKWINPKEIVWWSAALLVVCMTAVLLVAAFGRKVNVTGDSMSPKLKNGDVALVNHFVYNIKDPARGDIVVYREKKHQPYCVKRVVGIPGDTVQIVDGKLLINGKETKFQVDSYIEYAGVATEAIQVKEGEYFVMGDNADASDDSRSSHIGNIKKKDLFGCIWHVIASKK